MFHPFNVVGPLALVMKPLVGPNIKLCSPTDFLLLCHTGYTENTWCVVYPASAEQWLIVGLHSLCLEKITGSVLHVFYAITMILIGVFKSVTCQTLNTIVVM
jgi:hypothetical protein